MKQIFKTKCLFILFALTSLVTINLTAQTSKWNLKLSYGVENFTTEEYEQWLERQSNTKPNIRIECSYQVLTNLEIGTYLGYSSLGQPSPYQAQIQDINGVVTEITKYGFNSTNAFFYGLNANYHLLPVFIHNSNSRFDIYCIGQIGLVSDTWTNRNISESAFNITFLEYGLGIGAGYNFTKHLGVFGEYAVGRFYNDDNSQLRGGLRFKF